MNKQQEPRLRFKGFTEVWQEKVLGEFVKSLDAGVSVNSEDILPDSDEFSVLKTSCLSSGIFDKNEVKYGVKHIQASPLLFKYKGKYNYDFARVGMAIYGMEPLSEKTELYPVVKLSSKIKNIRKNQ